MNAEESQSAPKESLDGKGAPGRVAVAALQSRAAHCLGAYCASLSISDKRIDELIAHLNRMNDAESLPQWNDEGSKLALAGRGDALPPDLEEKVPAAKRLEFARLVEATVEVGIVDLYGYSTEVPRSFLEECLSILSENGIDLP